MQIENNTESAIINVREEVNHQISEHRNWYRAKAIAFIILGIIALFLPYATAFAVNIILGITLVIAGLFQLFSSCNTARKLAPGLSGLLSLITGFMLLVFPVGGAIAVGTLVAIFLLLEGAIEVLAGVSFRPFQGWAWLLVSGFLSMLLAVLVIAGWPSTTLLFYGVVIGINLIFFGASLLELASRSVWLPIGYQRADAYGY